MPMKITVRNVRITETKTPAEGELDVHYSGHVEFELSDGKATKMNLTMPFKGCVSMPDILSRGFAGLDAYMKQLQTAIRKAQTDHGL